MEQSVTALIIVCGLVAGAVGLVIASKRRRNRHRTENDDLGRQLGARWFTPEMGLPQGWLHDPFTGAPYSEIERPFDYAFVAPYRGRTVIAMEFTKTSLSHDTSRSRKTHHAIQLLGPQTPRLLVMPRVSGDVSKILWPDLTERTIGHADFDERFLVLAKDPATVDQVITPAIVAWFLARPKDVPMIIRFAGDGVEVTSSGGLPGWDTTQVLNELADLADLLEGGSVRPAQRLDLQTQSPPGNVMLRTLSGCLLGAAVVFWIASYTMSDPGGGLVVIGVIGGLIVLGIGLNLLLQRRRKNR